MARVILIETTPRRGADAVDVPLYLAGGGERAYTHKGRNDWRAGVATDPRFVTAIGFGQKGWTGGAIPQVGAIGFFPSDPALRDELAGYLWEGSPITVYSGDDSLPDPAWTVEMSGTIASSTIADGRLTLAVADLAKSLDVPLLKARFAGTGGLEGIAEAEGRIKRRTFGEAYNIAGEVLDKASNVYEFGDPAFPWQAFLAVKDKGRSGPMTVLAWQGSALATLNALKAAAPPSGGAVVAPSIACVKWWTVPSGPLTADVQGEVGAGYVNTAAAIAERVLQAANGPALAAGVLAAMNAERPAKMGLHISDDGETAAAALDRLLSPVSLFWSLEPAGVVRIGEFEFGAPVEAVDSIGQIERLETFKPITSRRVGYLANNHVHGDGEISAAVLLSDVAGAGALAGLDKVVVGSGGQLYREDGTTRLTQAEIRTIEGTAGAIFGQGALATANAADFGTQVTGVGKPEPGATLGADINGNVRDSSTGALLTRAQLLTALGIASGIFGQGSLATLSEVTSAEIRAGIISDNLVPNPLYVDGAAKWSAVGGTLVSVGGSAPAPKAMQFPHNVSAGLYANGGQPIPILAGTRRLHLSAWIYNDFILGPGILAAQCRSVSGAILGNPSVSAAVPSANGWHHVGEWIDLPVGTATAMLYWERAPVSDPSHFSYVVGLRGAATAPGATLGADINSNIRDSGNGNALLSRSQLLTSLGVASAIAGQGAFATLSNAAYGSPLLTGFGELASLGSVYFGSPYLLEASGGSQASIAAFKTALGIAAGILGQAAIATDADAVARILAMRGDNFVRNSDFGEGSAHYFFGNGGIYGALPAGAPSANGFVMPAAASGPYAYVNNRVAFAFGGRRIWASANIRNDGAAATFRLGAEAYDAGGALLASLFSDHVLATSAGGAFSVVSGSMNLPAGTAKVIGYVQRLGTNAGGPAYATFARFAATQAGGDVTAEAQIVVVPPATQTFNADHLGVIPADQFPRTIAPKVTRGGVDIRTQAGTSYAITTTGVTATGDNAAGSATKGQISITGTTGGWIDLVVTVDGVPQPAVRTLVERKLADPPATGAAGATSAQDSSLTNVSTTYAAISDVLTVRAPASGAISLSAPLSFQRVSTTAGTTSAWGKWQWRAVGGTFADVAAEIASTQNAVTAVAPGEPVEQYSGALSVNQSKTGLTAGVDYEFQLLARSSNAVISFPDGFARASQ